MSDVAIADLLQLVLKPQDFQARTHAIRCSMIFVIPCCEFVPYAEITSTYKKKLVRSEDEMFLDSSICLQRLWIKNIVKQNWNLFFCESELTDKSEIHVCAAQ